MKLKACALFAGGILAAFVLAAGPAAGTDSGKRAATTTATSKVTLCHPTGSKSNPYVKISVAASAVAADKKRGDVAPDANGKCPTKSATATTTTTSTPSSADFAVTFSATQTSTITNGCAHNVADLTLNAAFTSVVSIKATLKGGALTFDQNPDRPYHPLQTTVKVLETLCPQNVPPNSSPTKTCGPVTVLIDPGLAYFGAANGVLELRYGSIKQLFPGTDACSSGLMNLSPPWTVPLNPGYLLKKNVTDVAGTLTRSDTMSGTAQVQTVVKFTVRFTRLP